jgi:hypothetical protein
MTRSREVPKGLPKDWRKLARAIQEKGWEFEEGTKHVKAFGPGGGFLTLPKTPSDWRAYLNQRARFRRWCRERGLDPGI